MTENITPRERTVLDHVEQAGPFGITASVLRDRLNWHHGRTSGPLSDLHRKGFIVRLADKRDGYSLYVTPGNVGDRVPVPFNERKKRAAAKAPEVDVTALNAALDDERAKRHAAEERAAGLAAELLAASSSSFRLTAAEHAVIDRLPAVLAGNAGNEFVKVRLSSLRTIIGAFARATGS